MSRYKSWITRDGRKIPINRMTNSHLVNTIHYIERIARKYSQQLLFSAYRAINTMNGEMAIESIENDIMHIEECVDDTELLPAKLSNIYNDMYRLAVERNLL